MSVSVVLSTYNAPALLEKVLHGYAVQTRRDFEILVADDGSSDETRELISRLAHDLGLEIRHIWHEDQGFRKCTILNRAIDAARSDYLIFSDGDCIPRRDFVATHLNTREPGTFLSGGYVKLPRSVSEALTIEDIRNGKACDPRYLRRLGAGGRKIHRLHASGLFATLLDRLTTTRATWNGHCASGWRKDIVAANGFDERMKYGGEDRELGERLVNAGLRGIQIRHRAVCVHLWHERGYVTQEDLRENRRIRDETIREKTTVTPYGIRVAGNPQQRPSTANRAS